MLLDRIKNAVSLELLPVQGQTMSFADIEHRLAQLDEQFQQLLAEAIDADDKEAFSMYQTFLALRKEARCRYAEKYGPVDQSDMLGENSYSWLKDPWPWEYQSKTEG